MSGYQTKKIIENGEGSPVHALMVEHDAHYSTACGLFELLPQGQQTREAVSLFSGMQVDIYGQIRQCQGVRNGPAGARYCAESEFFDLVEGGLGTAVPRWREIRRKGSAQ
jgi:hypothetical protein